MHVWRRGSRISDTIKPSEIEFRWEKKRVSLASEGRAHKEKAETRQKHAAKPKWQKGVEKRYAVHRGGPFGDKSSFRGLFARVICAAKWPPAGITLSVEGAYRNNSDTWNRHREFLSLCKSDDPRPTGRYGILGTRDARGPETRCTSLPRRTIAFVRQDWFES